MDQYQIKYIPCSDSIQVATSSTITADRGDTFIQRYDCIKTFSETIEAPQQYTEGFSVWLETFVNIDGRYDTKRGITNLNAFDNNSYRVNPVYSQKPNL